MPSASVVVTGSEGFIGSHLVEALVRRGDRVRAMVLYNSFNSWGWLESLPARRSSTWAAGTGHSARELVQALAERVGFAGEIGEAAAGSPRSSDVPWQVADVSLAGRLLGWRAVHELRSTVELMTAVPTRPRTRR
jgi:nucleoside-diphosphate-sugar epimerase